MVAEILAMRDLLCIRQLERKPAEIMNILTTKQTPARESPAIIKSQVFP